MQDKDASTPSRSKKARKKKTTASSRTTGKLTSKKQSVRTSKKKKQATGRKKSTAKKPDNSRVASTSWKSSEIGSQSSSIDRKPLAAITARSSTRDFPVSFLWGCATAPTQVDGGDVNSDWYHWCLEKNKIADGSSCLTACEHWQHYEEDFTLMQQMGMQTYRLGTDWSRFQGEAGAPFDMAALHHFRQILQSLLDKNITPLITLNHFSIPQWWLRKGGWTREENLTEYYEFVDFLIEGVGDLVHLYITHNEPNVYALFAYLKGLWPPGKSGLTGLRAHNRVLRHIVMAHFHTYDRIREIHAKHAWQSPEISIAKHIRVMDPKKPEGALDVDRTAEAERRFNLIFTDCIQSGRLLGPLGRDEKIHDGDAWDYYGLNYYSRDTISFNWRDPGSLFIHVETNKEALHNDLGWEIYPEGIYRILKDIYERYGKPIRITENGIADVNDSKRSDFINNHLIQVKRAMDEGVPVLAYYHWSFMDNFEWHEGYTARFGLVHVDYETQKRTLRDSGKMYRKIIQTGRLPV